MYNTEIIIANHTYRVLAHQNHLPNNYYVFVYS